MPCSMLMPAVRLDPHDVHEVPHLLASGDGVVFAGGDVLERSDVQPVDALRWAESEVVGPGHDVDVDGVEGAADHPVRGRAVAEVAELRQRGGDASGIEPGWSEEVEVLAQPMAQQDREAGPAHERAALGQHARHLRPGVERACRQEVGVVSERRHATPACRG